MFENLKKIFNSSFKTEVQVMVQSPGEKFGLPGGLGLIAEEDMIIAFPEQLLEKNEPIGEVFKTDGKAYMNIHDNLVFLKLKKGMEVKVKYWTECFILSDKDGDDTPKRFSVRKKEISKIIEKSQKLQNDHQKHGPAW